MEGFGKDQVYFGDYVCALNYAVGLTSGSIPIIIEAEMPLDELNIDGVDYFAHISIRIATMVLCVKYLAKR